MLFTNVYNYPEGLVKAIKYNLYKPAWDKIRVSELLVGLLEKYLLIKHWDNLTVDVDDFVLSMFGTAWHNYLAGWLVNGESHNERWYAVLNNQQFSGETDVYDATNKTIQDNKVTSAWVFVFGRKDWERQLNCYAYLVQANNYPVEKLRINAFLRDWSKWDLLKDHSGTYPKSKFYCIEIPLWSKEKQENYLKQRLDLHHFAKGYLEISSLDNFACTPEERWQRPDQFAITKIGNKNALKCCDDLEQAKTYISKMKPQTAKNYEIVHRKGENKKCNDICIVRSVCPFRSN